jgi:hypothetical protein
MIKRIITYMSNPRGLVNVNAILLLAVILGNSLLQAFCIPTFWASLLLVICFLNTIVYPCLNQNSLWYYFSNYISGISLGVFVYCTLFLEHINFYGLFAIFFFGLGLLTYVPLFFIIQLLYKHIIASKKVLTKVLFCLGLLSFLLAAYFFNYQYKQALVSIEKFKQSNFTELDKTFMTEKILGMYFKYHTEICEYDGWRPPLHEPALVIGQLFNGRNDPLSVSSQNRFNLSERKKLYKKFFPDKKVKLNCSCAVNYSGFYHNDSLFKRN